MPASLRSELRAHDWKWQSDLEQADQIADRIKRETIRPCRRPSFPREEERSHLRRHPLSSCAANFFATRSCEEIVSSVSTTKVVPAGIVAANNWGALKAKTKMARTLRSVRRSVCFIR